ncbi:MULTISPECIES: hypothetical protein [Sphingosinicellaceae]|uniref:hypothetical protein n=1 Tax=Sphingosinicellaceae TaxID=2820280 RepID=UPI001C1E4E18|nr:MULTISPECIES: hypothetical protein [Polymorphobacter]QYE33527.1 hypothetical protein KZX46_01825 [Polymorphobacter sp. PAMC 29334]UAJ12222.1 hypothetical protein KTC28_20495 [Polymorphobacter megasporae]
MIAISIIGCTRLMFDWAASSLSIRMLEFMARFDSDCPLCRDIGSGHPKLGRVLTFNFGS